MDDEVDDEPLLPALPGAIGLALALALLASQEGDRGLRRDDIVVGSVGWLRLC